MTNGEKAEIDADNPYKDLTPHEQTGLAFSEVESSIGDLKNTAIKEIKNSSDKSIYLSFISLVIGAMLGVFGSLFVSVTLRWYDVEWSIYHPSFIHFLIGLLCLVLSLLFLIIRLIQLKRKERWRPLKRKQ